MTLKKDAAERYPSWEGPSHCQVGNTVPLDAAWPPCLGPLSLGRQLSLFCVLF